MQAITNEEVDWPQIDRVEMIVIPVQIGTSWILCITERFTLNQTTVRLTRGAFRVPTSQSFTTLMDLDLIMHSVGRGALDLWLRMVLRDIPAQEVGRQQVMHIINYDLGNEVFSVCHPVSYGAGVVNPG